MHDSKVCFKCEAEKPLSEFYKHQAMADGHLNKCISCTKKDVHEHRENNLDKIREYDRTRAKHPERAAAASRISTRWRMEDKRRTRCHNAVSRAVRSGAIEVKPCIICGNGRSYAHHESYDRPLDVVFYCQVHHKERHKQMAIEGIEP
jgi:hypothetical protein